MQRREDQGLTKKITVVAETRVLLTTTKKKDFDNNNTPK